MKDHQVLELEANAGKPVAAFSRGSYPILALINVSRIPKEDALRAFGVHLRGMALALGGPEVEVHVHRRCSHLEISILTPTT